MPRFVPLEKTRKNQRDAVQGNMLSLKEVLKGFKRIGEHSQSYVESYLMRSVNIQLLEVDVESQAEDRTIIVKRTNLVFSETECQVVNLTDITVYKRLKLEEEKTSMLKMLNTTVHHEMLAPLKANVDLSERLIKHLVKFPLLLKMA